MTETYSPFPTKKGTSIEWRFRRATWMSVRPFYGANGIKYDLQTIYRMFSLNFWWPFLTLRVVLFGFGIHAYIGWKPIPVEEDPAFFWNKLDAAKVVIHSGGRFVQLSCRWGAGRAATLE